MRCLVTWQCSELRAGSAKAFSACAALRELTSLPSSARGQSASPMCRGARVLSLSSLSLTGLLSQTHFPEPMLKRIEH